MRRAVIVGCLLAGLAGCGDGKGAYNGGGSGGGNAPSTPTNLAGNAGDTAVSLAWTAPASGTAPFAYTVTIAPTAAAAATTISGTAAVVRNLSNNTAYTFSIKASNTAGESAAATVQITPTAVAAIGSFTPVTVLNDAGATNGIRDASVLKQAGSEVWIAYSSVRNQTSGGIATRDTSTSLARSTDGGSTFTFVRTLGAAAPGTVTDSDPGRGACGATTCSGRWVYDTPWLLDDSSETNSARRYKVFAYKYFFAPGRPSGAALFPLGAIVMWTAPALNGTWSPETPVIGWNATPAELLPVASNINALTGTSDCALVGEGSAVVTAAGIDFVFNCPFGTDVGGLPALPQKIVLLRSTDHAATFQFVSTLLQPADATTFGSAQYFSAPSLVSATSGNGQALLVTPVIRRTVNSLLMPIYSGCVVLPFADAAAGTLVRDGNATPLAIATLPAPLTPTLDDHQYGACAWDRGVSATGILMNDALATAQPEQAQFTILRSNKSL
jgi:hypothetical protein